MPARLTSLVAKKLNHDISYVKEKDSNKNFHTNILLVLSVCTNSNSMCMAQGYWPLVNIAREGDDEECDSRSMN